MSEADVVELGGYVRCYWQPDISHGDAMANAASGCLHHHSWICPRVKSISGRAESSMIADHTGTLLTHKLLSSISPHQTTVAIETLFQQH